MLLPCAVTTSAPRCSHVQPEMPVTDVQVVGVAQSFCEVWETVATALAELDVLLWLCFYQAL